jgi:hypothetical protein
MTSLVRLASVLLSLVAITAIGAGHLDFKETASEPISLFNGKDLTGWEKYSNDKNAKLDELFSVDPVEKSIVIKGKPMGYLMTDKKYENYELTVEWRWAVSADTPRDPAKFKGNSGVLLHVSGPNKLWPKCVEAQLLSDSAGDFWLIDGYQLKVDAKRQDPRSARHFIKAKEHVEKPIGEWNKYLITCRGKSISLHVNDVEMNEGTDAEPSKGKIAIQSEGAEIHLRNLTLAPLK